MRKRGVVLFVALAVIAAAVVIPTSHLKSPDVQAAGQQASQATTGVPAPGLRGSALPATLYECGPSFNNIVYTQVLGLQVTNWTCANDTGSWQWMNTGTTVVQTRTTGSTAVPQGYGLVSQATVPNAFTRMIPMPTAGNIAGVSLDSTQPTDPLRVGQLGAVLLAFANQPQLNDTAIATAGGMATDAGLNADGTIKQVAQICNTIGIFGKIFGTTNDNGTPIIPPGPAPFYAYTNFVGPGQKGGLVCADSFDPISVPPYIRANQVMPVNADWNATTGLAQILNKPTIPAAQVNADWNATSGLAQILNKPALASVATLGTYASLTGVPTIPSTVTINSVSCALNGSCTVPTGSGTVTSFATGAWPSWLTPSVATATTTPTLAVSASAIPNSALANSSVTVNGTAVPLGGSVATRILGTTGSIGGTPLALGAYTSGTATVTGATLGSACFASPADGVKVSGVSTDCAVTANGVATVYLTAIIAVTPGAKSYKVVVEQ